MRRWSRKRAFLPEKNEDSLANRGKSLKRISQCFRSAWKKEGGRRVKFLEAGVYRGEFASIPIMAGVATLVPLFSSKIASRDRLQVGGSQRRWNRREQNKGRPCQTMKAQSGEWKSSETCRPCCQQTFVLPLKYKCIRASRRDKAPPPVTFCQGMVHIISPLCMVFIARP